MLLSDLLDCETCHRMHHKDYVHPSGGYEFRCQRCGHEWRTKVAGDVPKSCSRCHSCYYDRPRLGAIKPAKVKVRKRAQMKYKARKVAEAISRSGMEPPPSVRMGKG
jgi:NAD-dependent dihydropyrimidine dehydrogenase PreA subunit